VCDGYGVHADYTLVAAQGFRFLWAAHALLDVSPAARLVATEGTPTRVDIPAGESAAAPYLTGPWPAPNGHRLDRLGPDDGSAIGAVLTGCRSAVVVDGTDRLILRVYADPGVPVSMALWRNLGGFPEAAQYRSIGVEPILGAVFDLADAADAATVPTNGELEWRLELSAARTEEFP
ncbi:MAG: hypothetical protein ACRDRL_32975, partial [Sciscionella sp.]